jgi:CcmD family protein
VLTLVMAPALLVAQEAQKQFVPVENLPKQEVAPGPLVYGAYALVWAAVVIYLFSLWRRLGRVERELADVNRKLAGHR